MKLVECVPNFSEGRDESKIRAITAAIEAVPGIRLLDVDPGRNTNRTVVTFVGDPEAVLEAAFLAIQKAAEVIDMRMHRGEHARQGATDVCPFVPVSGVTMEECVALARRLGSRVGEELGIPVYLYEAAASEPRRRNLAYVRQGEYEGLPAKLIDPAFVPDFGPAVFNPRSGAIAIGAREFLIAYNLNLNTKDSKLANRVAVAIREQSKVEKDEVGKDLLDEQGAKRYTKGLLSCVKATGWYLEQYRTAQVSVNLTNYKVTPLHELVETTRKVAAELGLVVTGSELVGLIPKTALLEAGKFYLHRMNRSTGVSEEELVETAVRSLGLNELYPFDPKKKVIEYVIAEPPLLLGMNLREFANEVASDSPAPGGGSVAALCGALSCALSTMVANLTYTKKGFKQVKKELRLLAEEGQTLKDTFLSDVDEDTRAFNQVMAALLAPSEEKASRLAAANLAATSVPLGVLRRSLQALTYAEFVATNGNPNSLSDAGVAAITARACAEGAYLNVLINLPGLADKAFATAAKTEAEDLRARVRTSTETVLAAIEARL